MSDFRPLHLTHPRNSGTNRPGGVGNMGSMMLSQSSFQHPELSPSDRSSDNTVRSRRNDSMAGLNKTATGKGKEDGRGWDLKGHGSPWGGG